ncbi:MAG: hypothetical protein WAU36_15820, partial [Cyclobacteriaceae bacterium]
LTLGEAATNPEYQKKEKLVNLEIFFDEFREQELSKPNALNSLKQLKESFNIKTPNPADIKYDEKIYIKSRLEDLHQEIIEMGHHNPIKMNITAKEFTKLELDFNFVDKSTYIDYSSRAKMIYNLMKDKNHQVFNFISIQIEVKMETIHDYIRDSSLKCV